MSKFYLIFLLLYFCASDDTGNGGPVDDGNEQASSGNGWKLFEIDEVRAEHAAAGNNWYQFINESSMSMGLYVLNAGATDGQSPHGEDEVYYVLSGSAKLNAGSEVYDVTAGSIIFVKAGISHQFHTITERIEVLVLFSKTAFNPNDANAFEHSVTSVTSSRNPNQNVWNPFIDNSTMTFGMYMLPQALNGDNFLTHQNQEINIVVNGNSTFNIDGETVNVKPGSIFFVDTNFAHKFESLQADLDVLIFWNK